MLGTVTMLVSTWHNICLSVLAAAGHWAAHCHAEQFEGQIQVFHINLVNTARTNTVIYSPRGCNPSPPEFSGSIVIYSHRSSLVDDYLW